jgi:hypothetical protein
MADVVSCAARPGCATLLRMALARLVPWPQKKACRADAELPSSVAVCALQFACASCGRTSADRAMCDFCAVTPEQWRACPGGIIVPGFLELTVGTFLVAESSLGATELRVARFDTTVLPVPGRASQHCLALTCVVADESSTADFYIALSLAQLCARQPQRVVMHTATGTVVVTSLFPRPSVFSVSNHGWNGGRSRSPSNGCQ